jgi:transcription elongation GreA/GreB family factor
MEKVEEIRKISGHFGIAEEEIINLLQNDKHQKPKTVPPKKISKKPVAPTAPIKLKFEPVKQLSDKKYFFTEDDYQLLINKMDEVLAEVNRLGDEIGLSCAESESYHDNFCYEEGGRQQKMWTAYLRQLRLVKEKSVIIKKKENPDCVAIGSLVEIETENDEIIIKRIGSYLTFSDNDLSYKSPLAKLLIGKKIGSKIQGTINGKDVSLTIKNIT